MNKPRRRSTNRYIIHQTPHSSTPTTSATFYCCACRAWIPPKHGTHLDDLETTPTYVQDYLLTFEPLCQCFGCWWRYYLWPSQVSYSFRISMIFLRFLVSLFTISDGHGAYSAIQFYSTLACSFVDRSYSYASTLHHSAVFDFIGATWALCPP